MKAILHSTGKKTLFTLIILLGFFGYAQEPFYCDYNAYLFQKNDVYALDLASGSSYLVAENITDSNINGAGYNPTDGYIWGAIKSPARSVVRIGKNFAVDIIEIDNLPSSVTGSLGYVGDVSAEGIYYVRGGGTTFYVIDLNPESENYTKHLRTGTFSQSINIHDWAFNAVDGYLYTVEQKTNKLYRINTATDEITNLGVVPILSGLNYTYGAVYFDASGRFYVSANQTGTVYMIKNVQGLNVGDSMESNLFAFGPSSSSNDGARCPTAPVPQEDCINGIDDDGDGLTDCEDPACSGVAACPVIIVHEVSSGSDGGLESNDRLSEKINLRNYLRKKTNFNFDKTKAKKIVKTESYKKKSTDAAGFSLTDLIPLDAITGTTAVESSPTDLIDLTNATELYSVDYVKDNQTVAVILATKTENGVYEHTKFICDRLLGAELQSVSTIELVDDEVFEDVKFIRSIIKNTSGNIEFVLSFSGRLINNDQNFEIDSHWNIDKYEKDVTYYNFQIWADSVDDLYSLATETLELFEAQKPISEYSTSSPPPLFVKKGEYKNGALELQLINIRRSKSIVVDAGFKRTETSQTEYFNESIALQGTYIENLIIDTGNIFDIGFRIENEYNLTPDDIFMSDGVWGKDDSPKGTTVSEFVISQNDDIYSGNGHRVERNISLKSTTSEYVSAFRSFTPRYTAVDLSQYDVFEIDASGTGELEITIAKEGIGEWANQFRTTITLNENETHYAIPFAHFTSAAGGKMDLSDALNLVFTMSSDGTKVVDKEMNLKNIQFTEQVLSVGTEVIAENEVVVNPNPLNISSELSFYAETDANTHIEIYSITGALVRKFEENTIIGNNKFQLKRGGLKTGMYFIKIRNDFRNYKTLKLVVD